MDEGARDLRESIGLSGPFRRTDCAAPSPVRLRKTGDAFRAFVAKAVSNGSVIVTAERLHSPRIDGHALKDPLARRAHDDKVPDMVLICEMLESGDELMHERDALQQVHRRMDTVLHVCMLGGVLDELLETRGGKPGVLGRCGEIVGVDGFDGLRLGDVRGDVRHISRATAVLIVVVVVVVVGRDVLSSFCGGSWLAECR